MGMLWIGEADQSLGDQFLDHGIQGVRDFCISKPPCEFSHRHRPVHLQLVNNHRANLHGRASGGTGMLAWLYYSRLLLASEGWMNGKDDREIATLAIGLKPRRFGTVAAHRLHDGWNACVPSFS